MSHDDDNGKKTPEDEEAERRQKTEAWKAAVDPLLEEIRRMIQQSGWSQRAVEQRAGFSRGYMAQLLARNLEIKVRHLLAILDVLGEDAETTFGRVYPRRPRYSALESFRRRSQPLSEEMDDLLSELYQKTGESLAELRARLARCEQAIAKLRARGHRHELDEDE